MRFLSVLFACLISLPIMAQKSDQIRVASYNIRNQYPLEGENSWPFRRDQVKALIQYHDFDIIGSQECIYEQLQDICQLPGYTYFGAGRDDGKTQGEHSAIIYKKDRFEVLESGNFWLSETPDKPSLGWDATCCNRICSWVKFKDKNTKKTFYFFSVHFDHQGRVARVESGKLMVQKIKEIAKDAPVICTGDFNSRPDTEQIQTMQTILNDSYKITKMPPYGPVGTSNGFRFTAPMTSRIDYVFVSNQFTVFKYGVLTDSFDQHYPSDHQPVVVDLKL